MALQTSHNFDEKWKRADPKRLFSDEGLTEMWAELKNDRELQTVGKSVSVATTPASGVPQPTADAATEGVGEGARDANTRAGGGGGGGGGEEGKDVDEIVGRQKRSPFFNILAEWTWGQEPSLEHLREAVRTLATEQQELSLRAACSTSSLSRLNKRLVLFERVLIALSRREQEEKEGEREGGKGEREGGAGEEGEGREKMDRERERETEDEQRQPAQQEVVVPKAAAPPPPSLSTDVALAPVPAPLPPTLVSDGFARIGARTALSFAFAFLRQAWRTEDDSGLCEQVFHEAREILQELPVGLIFDSRHVSDVWIEVVDRTMTFLTRICQGPKGEVEVPQSSRHAALSLLLELSLHRAKLHKLLGIVFLLLQLATGGMVSSQPSPSLLMCSLQIIVFWAISATISIVCKIISVGYQIRMLPLHHCYLKGSNYAL
ncbi:E3 ubiquitin-protein ligase HERC2 [Geodia barretti]|uniref:E3 ubiquitin-protein ligase HERC2 n=1 Tax=Geodia barretti TaxID=519541 RepID=A0AA35SC88_GEOBA|nr:E3 ubiquitin-protein ligase HERC2 [Geodia barretti]